MTPEQLHAIELLSRCTFLPGCHDKRFVRFLVNKANDPEPLPLTPKQADWLWTMVHRYRRQHKRCTCLKCLKAQNPNFNPHQQTLFEEERLR